MDSLVKVREEPSTCVRAPVISIRDLRFSFEAGGVASVSGHDDPRPALDGVSLDILPGELVVITGLSGCGKSTLAMAMGGYIPHVVRGRMSGEVLVKGQDTRTTDLSDLAAVVSLCQQDPEAQLCTLSVYDEVAFGPENLVLPAEEVVRRVDASLAAVNASHLRGRGIAELSGGEKQRVAIASMLAMGTEVLLLDEPTSSLDPDSAADVLSAIDRLSAERQRTVIVIEHRLSRLLGRADRLVVMDSGRVVLDGKPAEVYPAYEQLLGKHRPAAAVPHLGGDRLASASGQAAVQVEGLRFSYGDREVLRDVSFAAYPGELVGIVGSNGSGKSSFLACLTALLKRASGEVTIAGAGTAKAKPSDLARQVGFVFQNPHHQIFEKTVQAEITFARDNFGMDREATIRLAGQVMDTYGLSRHKSRHPLRLSYGEKRRLNLCSVLPHDPGIIVLDEPFTGQDAANCSRMIQDILCLKEGGKTILMVSHDIDLVFKYCDRVVLFDSGRIIVDDAPAPAAEKIRAAGKLNYLPGSCGG